MLRLITGQSKVWGEICWLQIINRVEPPDAALPLWERQPSPESWILTAIVPAPTNLSDPCQVSGVIQPSQYLKHHLRLEEHNYNGVLNPFFSFFLLPLHVFLFFLYFSLSSFSLFLFFLDILSLPPLLWFQLNISFFNEKNEMRWICQGSPASFGRFWAGLSSPRALFWGSSSCIQSSSILPRFKFFNDFSTSTLSFHSECCAITVSLICTSSS